MTSADDTHKLIEQHWRRRQTLQERPATPEVLAELKTIEAELKKWQGQLEAEQAQLQQTLADTAGLSSPVAAQIRLPIEQRLAELEGLLQTLTALTRFDQRGQQVGVQYNVAGDFIQQAAPLPSADPAALQRAYLHRLMQQTRRLPLTGVDPKAAGSDAESHELLLAAVYTALLTRDPAGVEDLGQGRRPQPAEREARPLSALEVLNRKPRLVLLGDPGSGKSTFVNFVTLCLAGQALDDPGANLALLTAPLPVEEKREKNKPPQPQPWQHGFLLPVQIVLRDLAARGLPQPGRPASGDTLWAFIAAELGETLKEYGPYLKKTLQEQGGLILLDGLDEVPDAHQRRVQVKQAVQAFAADFPRCRFLVTSRTYAYQHQDWKLDGFSEVVLSPFSPAQIAHFVERWYQHIGPGRGLAPADAQGRAVLLQTAIERSERLAELASRPLLLTLMASLHAWRGGSLPEKREELYADAVDLLLDQWESHKARRRPDGSYELVQPSLAEWLKVDKAVVRAELNRLAFEAHRDQPQLADTADVSQERLLAALLKVSRRSEPINPLQLEAYLRDRAGLLAARGEGVYTFPHRTFQEYLAACHLTDADFPYQVADLLRAEAPRWREATLLAGAKAARGSASAAWNLADALCYHEPPAQDYAQAEGGDCFGALLAAQVLLENEAERLGQISERNAPKLERIRAWLRAIVERGWLPPVDRALAGQALAVLGDERDFDQLILIPAGAFVMGSGPADRQASDDEKPQHELVLPGFKIGKYPVTNAQYRPFMEAGGYQEKRWWTQAGWAEKKKPSYEDEPWREPRYWHDSRFNRPNQPVVGVSWYEAVAYCCWLTAVWRSEGQLAATEVVRLPSEAEWEKAARGEKGRIYPWGDEWDQTRGNTGELGLGSPCAVGMFPTGASPFGCLDMAGQVWEWCATRWQKDYPYDIQENEWTSGYLEGEALRVVRGGSWDDGQNFARCACRFRSRANFRDAYQGFRVVVSSISPPSAL
jgi:formylglycine-generating enzyme required for sulfatase activity